uniref:Uncharacterized protein n=1 Tax=Rhizophora mucronata TaxID=61149 RepID=A0A2P2PIY0_RHIMU
MAPVMICGCWLSSKSTFNFPIHQFLLVLPKKKEIAAGLTSILKTRSSFFSVTAAMSTLRDQYDPLQQFFFNHSLAALFPLRP